MSGRWVDALILTVGALLLAGVVRWFDALDTRAQAARDFRCGIAFRAAPTARDSAAVFVKMRDCAYVTREAQP